MKNMRYLDSEGVWLLPPPEGESFEIIVAGNQSAPSAARMAMVEKAIPKIGELCAKAISYLDAFVDRNKFAPGDNWYFEGLDSGRLAGQSEDQLSLYFSIEGDTYGEWSVSFQITGPHHFPIAFFRRQY